MKSSWEFFAIVAATPCGFTWRWRKLGAKAPVTSAVFDFYFDCISNARRNGYTGALPPGPKVPLDRLPDGPVKTGHVSAPLSKDGSAKLVMTLAPIAGVRVPTDVRS